MSMSALADRSGSTPGVMTIADQLEERGLIERQPHPTDRRIKSLAHTRGPAAPRRVADELWVEVPVLDALTAAERRELWRSSHGPSSGIGRLRCSGSSAPQDDLEDRQREVAQRSPTSDIVPPRRSRDTRQDRDSLGTDCPTPLLIGRSATISGAHLGEGPMQRELVERGTRRRRAQ